MTILAPSGHVGVMRFLVIALVCVGCGGSSAVAPGFDGGATGGRPGTGGEIATGGNSGTGGALATGTGGSVTIDATSGTGGAGVVACATLDQVTGAFQGTSEWTDLSQDFPGCPSATQGRQPSVDVAAGQLTDSTDQGIMSLANASGPIVAHGFTSHPTDGGACSFTVEYTWPTPLGDGSFGAGVGQPECGDAHMIVTGTVSAP